MFDLEDLSFSNTLKLRAENLNDYADLEGHTPKQVFSRQDGTFLVVYYPGVLLLKNAEIFIHFVIQNRTGDIISEPFLKVRDRVYLSQEVETEIASMSVMHDFPFSPKTVFDVANNGVIYSAWTSDFKIDVYSPEGEKLRSIEHPFENQPLDIEKLRAHYKETNYMWQLGEGVTEKILEQEENIPGAWPAIQDLLIDDENRLWVSTVVEDQDVYEWWLMEETGELITKFEWPQDKPIELIRNGNIYTREEQADSGEDEVVRYGFELGG